MTQPCPICGEPATRGDKRKSAYPFCSERCRLVDLGQWLNESYRIPDLEAAMFPSSDDDTYES